MALRIHLAGRWSEGETLVLPPAESRHVQVLRLQPGDTLTLFNGEDELEWPAEVVRIGRNAVELRIAAPPRAVERELPVAVTLAIGIPANERMDALVEKATELGVAALQPLICERSVVRLAGERAEARQRHWQAVAASATEQCGRARVPRVALPTRFEVVPPDDPPEAVEEFCAALRTRRFDLGVQLHGGGGNANPLLLRFGARITAGSRAPGAAPLDRTVPWTSFQHDLMRWLEVVALVGAPPVHLQPRVAVTARDRGQAADALGELDGSPLVAMHPGATDPRRRWLPDRLGELGAALTTRGARVVLLGGAGDAPLVDRIRDGLGPAADRAVDLAGRLSLGGLVGVLERADLFVGNDSGPRHLAEAVGTATVGVFTRANLVDVAPLFRTRHRVLVSWASRCSVCGVDYFADPCGHDASVLGDVTVDDVLAPALELLDLPVREPAPSR